MVRIIMRFIIILSLYLFLFGFRLKTLHFDGCYFISVSSSELFESGKISREVIMQFHLEAGHHLYFYYEDVKAREHFDIAKKLSGLSIELKGFVNFNYCLYSIVSK